MCDYSLHHVASRPANTDDKLISTKFNNSITRGFAAVNDRRVAVCLMPGTEVAFDKDVEVEPAFGFFPKRRIAQRVARFRHINEEHPSAHHDALEFPNGQIVLVTRLCEGQNVTVLQLPATARPATAEEQAQEPAVSGQIA
jgi:hypothetical protein